MTLGSVLSLLSLKKKKSTDTHLTHTKKDEKDRDSCESFYSKNKCREEKEWLITRGKSLT